MRWTGYPPAERFRLTPIDLHMDRKELIAKIAELRDAAEQARALSVDLTAPEAEQGFLELARKLEEQAAALERRLKPTVKKSGA